MTNMPTLSPVKTMTTFFFPDARRRDIDNYKKALYDALSGIIWQDDSQIWDETTRKVISRHNPRIEIEVCLSQKHEELN